MESSREKKIGKTKAVLEVNSNQAAGEHHADMGWVRKDHDEQSPVEGYGRGPTPHKWQRGWLQKVSKLITVSKKASNITLSSFWSSR